jgi:hypothetical protein
MEKKYVVIGEKKMPGGSRVMCAAMPKLDAESTLKRLEAHEYSKQFGPFKIVSQDEAEKKKMYGD